MNQKKAEYIALYSLVFGVILVFGILIRQFVLSKGIDDFSSTVAFFATVIVLTALYSSLQITFNQFLLPRIEAFLFCFSAFQKMKDNNDAVSFPEAPTIKDSNQAPLKKQSPNLQNMKSCAPMLLQKRIALFKPNWKRFSTIRSKQWLPI